MSHMHQGVEILREVIMGQIFPNIVLAVVKGKTLSYKPKQKNQADSQEKDEKGVSCLGLTIAHSLNRIYKRGS